MITGSGVYHVVETMAPLYTAAALGYASVRWLGAFSEEQCAGINHFVSTYALPALIFDMVSTNDPYAMNVRLVAVERALQVTVNVESTEPTRQQGMAVAGQQATAALTTEVSAGEDAEGAEAEDDSLPASPSTRHIALMTGKKVLKIPNTYASFLGLIWALITFKCGIKMPKIIIDSLFTIQTTTIGLSMFSSGTFMARQPQFIPCGYAIATVSLVLKFLIGPVAMLLASLAVGMHGTLLRIAVVQAALPLAVASFVYAEEYKFHAYIMSTGVILGIFISFPVTIVYYILLEL